MKAISLTACTVFAAAAFAAAPPAGTRLFNGGRVEPVGMSLIETSSEHLNFCFAHRFPDGTIYLNHSSGIHTVTERACRDWSPDGGKTIVAVSSSNDPQEFSIDLGDTKIESLNRHLYDPEKIVADDKAEILPIDKEIKNVSGKLNDTIPAYGVAVYTTYQD